MRGSGFSNEQGGTNKPCIIIIILMFILGTVV